MGQLVVQMGQYKPQMAHLECNKVNSGLKWVFSVSNGSKWAPIGSTWGKISQVAAQISQLVSQICQPSHNRVNLRLNWVNWGLNWVNYGLKWVCSLAKAQLGQFDSNGLTLCSDQLGILLSQIRAVMG